MRADVSSGRDAYTGWLVVQPRGHVSSQAQGHLQVKLKVQLQVQF